MIESSMLSAWDRHGAANFAAASSHVCLALMDSARMPGRARGPLYGPTALPRHPVAVARRRQPLPRRRGEIH